MDECNTIGGIYCTQSKHTPQILYQQIRRKPQKYGNL